MPLKKPSITDDRGKRMPLVPHDWTLHLRGDDARSRRLRDASKIPKRPPTRGEVIRGIGYGLVALPVVVLVSIGPSYFAIQLRWNWAVTILAMLPLAAVPAAVTVRLARLVAAERIARIYLHASYCASCGYDLAPTPPEPDGCRVCSECGAAWKLDGTPPGIDLASRN